MLQRQPLRRGGPTIRTLTQLLTVAAASALALGGISAPASAVNTWTFPTGTFTANDQMGNGQATITVTNLAVTEAGAAKGYVSVVGRNNSGRVDSCSTSAFSGASAIFSPTNSSPCNGYITFSVDQKTGTLSALANFNMSSVSVWPNGAASGSVTGTLPTPVVVPLQGCQLTFDRAAHAVTVAWTPNSDASTYDLSFGGDVVFNYAGLTGDSIDVPADILQVDNPAPGIMHTFNASLTGKRSDGATVATCTTNTLVLAAPGSPVIDKTVPVAQGGLVTVNY